MKQLNHNELRSIFLDFFAKRDHLLVPSAPLVPRNDRSTLFTTAGVQPLISYLKMEQDSPASRLADSQKCLRTNDIDEVGDNTHLTFFEMLGSWSIGDYNKETAIEYAHDFLTSEEGLGIPKDRLWVTVFNGGNDLPKDDEAAQIWQKLGMPKERIAYLPESDNWWSMGEEGLCGPDTEIFYDLHWPSPVPAGQNPGNDPDNRFVEIWNTVFMSYNKKDSKLTLLPSHNIDEGAGLERLLSVINNKNIYDTSCFKDSMDILRANSRIKDKTATVPLRIIADHLRTILFILSEDPPIYPSASEHGYILRRLIRSVIKNGDRMGLDPSSYEKIFKTNVNLYQSYYPEIAKGIDNKIRIFTEEGEKFRKILSRAPNVWEQFTKSIKGQEIPTEIIFRMVTERGIPFDVVGDLADANNKIINQDEYEKLVMQHKATSREPKP